MRVIVNDDARSRRERRVGTKRRGRRLLPGAILAVSLLAAGCAQAATAVGSGPLTIGVLDPFTGDEAFAGPAIEAECYAAVDQINAAGGVLGHKMQCSPYDSTSDPADAVPVATRMLATASNLVLVAGPVDQEPAVEPLLNAAKVIHFAENGEPAYDHQTSPYFYRPFGSDSLAGVAEAIYLIQHGYTHAAGVFDTSSGSQTQVPNLLKTYAKLGGKIAIKLTLAPGGTYRTEVALLVAAKPDAIISELDSSQEVSAWYSELGQLSHGNLPPMIPTYAEVTSTTNWIGVVQHSLGTTVGSDIAQLSPGGAFDGPGYSAFKDALLSAPQNIAGRQQYLATAWIEQGYDAMVMDALAMDEAKSTDSAKAGPLIAQIANGVPGATTVSTYAAGAKAIADGHRVHYVGASGEMEFNQWHNIVTPFQIFSYQGPAAGWVALPGQTITAQQVSQAMP